MSQAGELLIILLGGTTEGRQAARKLLELGHAVTLAVVTDHAAALARKDLVGWEIRHEGGEASGAILDGETECDLVAKENGRLRIRVGPLDETGLRAILQDADALVDATHPFATKISSLAKQVCASLQVPYLRVDRPRVTLPPEAIVLPSAEAAARRCVAEGGTGAIFLTVGVRTLPVYVAAARAAGRRVVARVLPTQESLAACVACGLAPQEIVALHGPPDLETDRALLKRFGATVMVMKDSGGVGGIEQKLAACREVGAIPIVVARPLDGLGQTAEEALSVEDLPLALERLGVAPSLALIDSRGEMSRRLQDGEASRRLQEGEASQRLQDGRSLSRTLHCRGNRDSSVAVRPQGSWHSSRNVLSKRRPSRVLMVVGTGSHVGKTLLVAALCRFYAKRGLRVAPFKAQNMALNSYVTPEGGEIGRAQAFQAEAAGVEPHVDMNPILLKPSSSTGSQVVLLGRPVAHMQVREYHAFQPLAWSHAAAALDRLRANYELVIIEGAGGVAEINLRDRDIVNMRVAKYCSAPTLLVGDIDRGGVFASLYGSALLLEPDERTLIKGFVINKFRGDPSLLAPGLAFLEKSTGIPVLGVIPYLADWRGDEEDSLGLESHSRVAKWPASSDLRVAVVRLPFISNYTDFDALEVEPNVCLRYVSSPDELAQAHLVILPGTKSTVADLAWLRKRGLADCILQMAAQGIPVIGICGGYQMLGRAIRDPHGVESDIPQAEGLGLLDVVTTFAPEKRTTRVKGELLGTALGPSGTPVYGYEIHMGETTLLENTKPLLRLHDSAGASHLDGAVSTSGAVIGTYVHGLFDGLALRQAALAWARRLAGLPNTDFDASTVTLHEREISARPESVSRHLMMDRLCEHVTQHLDVARIDSLIGIG